MNNPFSLSSCLDVCVCLFVWVVVCLFDCFFGFVCIKKKLKRLNRSKYFWHLTCPREGLWLVEVKQFFWKLKMSKFLRFQTVKKFKQKDRRFFLNNLTFRGQTWKCFSLVYGLEWSSEHNRKYAPKKISPKFKMLYSYLHMVGNIFILIWSQRNKWYRISLDWNISKVPLFNWKFIKIALIANACSWRGSWLRNHSFSSWVWKRII